MYGNVLVHLLHCALLLHILRLVGNVIPLPNLVPNGIHTRENIDKKFIAQVATARERPIQTMLFLLPLDVSHPVLRVSVGLAML